MSSEPSIVALLSGALALPGCPTCRIVATLVHDELCRLQRDVIVDPRAMADVVACGGYCATHWWYLERLASPWTNARVLLPLIERLGARVQAAASHEPPQGVPQQRACPVCKRVAVWEDTAAAAVAALGDDDTRHAPYAAGMGLCVPHLAQTVERCSAPRALALLQDAATQAHRLAQALRTYLERHDAGEHPRGADAAAPRLAIEKLSGSPHRGG